MIFRNNNEFERFSIAGWFSERWNSFVEKFSVATGQDEFRGDETGTGGWISLPFRLAVTILVFLLTSWSTSRKGSAFGYAVPALITAGGFLALLVLAFNVPFRAGPVAVPDSTGKYKAWMQVLQRKALEDRTSKPEESRLHARRAVMLAEHLVLIRPRMAEYKYDLGVSREIDGNLPGARNVIEWVANDVTTGAFPMANLWLANDIMRSTDRGLSIEEKTIQTAEQIDRVQDDPSDDQLSAETQLTRMRLAQLMAEQEKFDEAAGIFEKVISDKLKNLVQLSAIIGLADIYRKAGETEKLQALIEVSTPRISELAMQFPNVPYLYQTLISLHLMRDDFKSAAAAIRDGIIAATDSGARNQLIQLQDLLYLQESAKVPDIDSRENYQKKLGILSRALRLNPFTGNTYIELLPFVDIDREKTEEGEWLRELFLDTDIPADILNVIIGFREMLGGNYSTGQNYWLMALRNNPSTVVIVNNFLSAIQKTRPEKCRTLADLALVSIEMFPNQEILHMTRARIMFELKEYKIAINELETVLSKAPDEPLPMELMVQCLKETGETERAAEVQKQLDIVIQKRENEKLEAALLK